MKSVISSIFTATDKFSPVMRSMGRGVQGFAAKTEVAVARVEMATRRLTSPLRKINSMLGGFGLMLGGAAITGILGGGIKIFKDFEQANANLASVMADATRPELKALQKDAMRLGATTAKSATEVVGLQEAYGRLGFKSGAIIDMTEATINGSIAMNSELSATAELTGAMVNSFDAFSSTDAPKILDIMTAATQKTALSFEGLQAGLPIVAGAANSAGISFTRMTSLLGKLADAGIDTSSSATSLRNIFLDSAAKGHTYDQVLDNIMKSKDKLTAANDKFGKRGAVSAVILGKQMEAVKLLDTELQNAGGTAKNAAEKQLNTLNGALTILSSSYEGFILSLENGEGKFSGFLKTVAQVASEMLSLASGSAVAKNELSDAGKEIRGMAETGMTLLSILKWTVITFVALKAIIMLVKIGLAAYNIVLGITGALSGTASIAIGKNSIALGAYNIVTALATKVTGGFAVALGIAGAPIWLIALAIIALIALVTIIIIKWNEWGAALSLLLGPLGMIISLIQSFRRNWDAISAAFKSGNILEGFKLIGATILDSILMPLQQVFSLMTNLPGVGKYAQNLVNKIGELRTNIGVNTTTDESGKQTELAKSAPLLNTQAQKEENMRQMFAETRSRVDLNVNDPNNRVTATSDSDNVKINVGSTLPSF
jgi:hypothetical protein